MATPVRAVPEGQLMLPAELRTISTDILRLILPDVSLSVDPSQSHCHKVTFTVHLSPGLIRRSGNQAVLVRVKDKVSGNLETVGEVKLFVPAAGGSATASIEFPMPPDAQFTPDFFNEITVVADPDNQISERNEANNTVIFVGTCIG